MKTNEAPEPEQRICLACGFCCDGTLFRSATLVPGERGSLPERIEENCFDEKGKEYFRLPCLYFAGKCTIYAAKKAFVCSAYRCRLLNTFSSGTITTEEALMVVADARELRDTVTDLYKTLTGKHDGITFRKVLSELNSVRKGAAENHRKDPGAELLVARCNILEALLIKYFRSAEDFEKLIMK